MKLKLDEAGHAVLKDGHPIYVYDDGKEIPFDAAAARATISRLNGEAKGHRERAEASDAKLKAFEGIEDPAAALKALDTVSKLDAKKLLDAGEVDRVRAEAQTAFDHKLKGVEEKYKPIVKERDGLRAALVNEKVGGAFSRSKFIADKLVIPSDLVQAKFGAAFRLEDDKVIAYSPDGKQVYSRAKPGEIADFDEALEILVDSYPHRDSILKGSGAHGGGSGGGSNGANGSKSVTRALWDSMDEGSRQAHLKSGGAVRDAA